MSPAGPHSPGALPAVLLGALAAAQGCSSAPPVDALRSSIVLNNEAASALRAEQARHASALRADIARRAAPCRSLPPVEQPGCFQRATQDALSAAAPDATRLTELALLQRAAASSLEAAAQCRADGLPCEAEHLREAASSLSRARAGLGGGEQATVHSAMPGVQDRAEAGGPEEP